MAMAPEQAGIGIRRFFTTDGVHPYDEIEWERRDARITNYRDGQVAFEQLGVEVPVGWSLNATNILAQKYFRGTLGTPEREWSLKQVADRVVDTITKWGTDGGYFTDDREAAAFSAELKHLVVTQKAAFNSPVWFNIGVAGVPQQASACFILAVDDTMDSILNWYVEEGTIFKGGSGAGINLSKIRSSLELLKGGGTASGPVSFMRGADSSAGTIKSGGKTRRAAKMVILDVDHPDVEEFIWCKAREERKARVLRDAGFDMDLDGADSHSTQYQNANNSVRVTDEFMQAVLDDADWHLLAVKTGETLKTIKARELMRQISMATWECADPGMQFDTTINRWHTAHNTGRINGSNPCFPGDALVHTDKGLVSFEELIDRTRDDETFGVYTHDATNPDTPSERLEISSPDAVMITGRNEIVKLTFSNGMQLRCTPNHRIFTRNRGFVRADELTERDELKTLDLAAPAVHADYRVPVSTDVTMYTDRDTRSTRGLRLPEKWTDEFAHYLGWLVGDGCTSGDMVTTVYGNDIEREAFLGRHQTVLAEINGGRVPKPSEQRNGTVQLRSSRRAVARFFEALGLHTGRAATKVLPWSIEQAPSDVAALFLRGLFDADGCVYDGENYRYVGLGSVSADLLRGVQRLLTTFGIVSTTYATRRAGDSEFLHVDKDGTVHVYEGGQLYDLRITSGSIARFAEVIGFDHPTKKAKLANLLATRSFHRPTARARLVDRVDDGVELTYNLSEPRNHSYVVERRRGGQLLRVHASRQLGVQPRQHQLAEVPRHERRVRRRRLQGRGRGRVHRAGDPRRQRRLPDRVDRRHEPPVPSARHRLRQPRRAAHGAGLGLRLRCRPRLGGGDHRAAHRSRLRGVGPHGGAHGPVRRLRREQRAHAACARHASPGGRAHRRRARACGSVVRRTRGVGQRVRPRQHLRRAQLAGERLGTYRNYRVAHGL